MFDIFRRLGAPFFRARRPRPAPSTAPYPTGWIDSPDRHAIAAGLPTFQRSWIKEQEPSGPILLYKAWRDVLGDYPDYVAQGIGDCVGMGNGHGCDLGQAVDVALGQQDEYSETSTEWIYAGSRKVAGILSNQDGSFGSAAMQFAITVGHLPRTAAYSPRLAKEWGLYGPPEEYAGQARKIGGAALILDWPSLVSALWNGMPVVICSDQGFTMERDADGFCAPQGVWNHCMLICGVRFGRNPGACILQSWGRNVPRGPLALEQPDYSFWSPRRVVERILAQRDSWAIMDAPEFRRRNLPRRLLAA